MKRTMMVICIFAGLWVMSSIALAHDQNPSFASYTVKFNPNKQKGELEAVSINDKCTKGKGDRLGCVNFPLNSIGLVTFSVDNKVKQCGDPGAKWVITKIELTDKGFIFPDNEISDKGIFNDAVDSWLIAAFPQYDDQDNVLYEVDNKDNGVTQVTRLNLNNNSGIQNIWYRITVADCDSDLILVTDPRFENQGKN